MDDIRNLVVDDDLFDPLADDVESEEPEPDDTPMIGEAMEEKSEPEFDPRPPYQRIQDLLKSMPAQRRLLLRLIDFCREEKTVAEMDEKTDELREYNFSVYSNVVFRELLQKAGAIEYLEAEGEESSADGDEVLSEDYSDGEENLELEYREIGEMPAGTWIATEDGLAVVEEQDDYSHVKALIDGERQYKTIYQRILGFCTEDGGRSSKEIDALVNNEAVLQEPRRYSGYFVGRLEREGALEWRGGWTTTDTGGKILETLIS